MKRNVAVLIKNETQYRLLEEHYKKNGWVSAGTGNKDFQSYENFTEDNIDDCIKIGNNYSYRNSLKAINDGWDIIDFDTYAIIAGIDYKPEIVIDLTIGKATVYADGVTFEHAAISLSGKTLYEIYNAYQSLLS